MKRIIFILVGFIITINLFSQKSPQKESYYQYLFAKEIGGKMEVVLDDQARVDIVTDTFAIEVDFAHKWGETIGQSLYYGIKLDKKPGVLFIINGNNDKRYVERLLQVSIRHNITVWLMDYNTEEWTRVRYNHTYSY